MTRTHRPLTPKQLAELRGQIVLDSERIRQVANRRRKLRERMAALVTEEREVTQRRDANLRLARKNGLDAFELAADSGLTPGRVRQIAPTGTGRGGARRPGSSTPASTRRVEVTMPVDDAGDQLVDDDQEEELVQEDEQPAPALSGIAAAVAALPPQPVRPAAPGKPAPGKRLPKVGARVYSIAGRVEEALELHGGDMEAATAALVASAVPDAMVLLDQCRAGARYDFTAHPRLPEPLQPRGRKKADLIWEGRPAWRARNTHPGTPIDVLDVNGAYLAALRRVHLPIGKLEADEPGTPYNPRRAGIYLVDPPAWTVPIPNPIGDGREETGPVWITTPTLRLMHRAYGPDIPIPILESYTSGASESLLGKFGDELAAARRQAIADGDPVTLEYVKKLYSKFVSTAGASSANHEIMRPEWVHSIRAQAFMNLWLKGARAAQLGIYVHALVGTDELHVAGPWRQAVWSGRPAFPIGRDLSQIECKRSYVVAGHDDQPEVTRA